MFYPCQSLVLKPSCSVYFPLRREFELGPVPVFGSHENRKAKSPRRLCYPPLPPLTSERVLTHPPRQQHSSSSQPLAPLCLVSPPHARSHAAALARRGPSNPEARVRGRPHGGARAGPDPGGVTRIRRAGGRGGGGWGEWPWRPRRLSSSRCSSPSPSSDGSSSRKPLLHPSLASARAVGVPVGQ